MLLMLFNIKEPKTKIFKIFVCLSVCLFTQLQIVVYCILANLPQLSVRFISIELPETLRLNVGIK